MTYERGGTAGADGPCRSRLCGRCGSAAQEEKAQVALVVGRGKDGHRRLPLRHAKARGQIQAHGRRLGVLQLVQAYLVDLVLRGEHQKLGTIGGLKALCDFIALFEQYPTLGARLGIDTYKPFFDS